MTSSTVRIGVLGAGGVAGACHLPILAQMPGAKIAWLCDQERDRAVRLAREWGVKAAFGDIRDCPDVDAVLIAIPVGRRREALSVAFERGWHALVEKPFATSVQEHLRIVQEAARAGVVVGVGLVRRFFRSTSIVRLALSRETFGPVLEVWAAEAARMGTTGREGSWYQADRSAAGGGVLMETGSHIVDQVFHALGAEAFNDLRAGFTNAGDIDLEVRAVTNVKCAGAGSAVPLHLLLSRMRDLYTGVVIRCRHATVRFGLSPDSPVEVLQRDDKPLCRLEESVSGKPCATNVYQAFFLEWQAFLEQCRSRTPSLVDASSSLLSTHFIEAAYGSAAAAGART